MLQALVYGDSLRAQLVAVVVPDPEVLLPWAKERSLPQVGRRGAGGGAGRGLAGRSRAQGCSWAFAGDPPPHHTEMQSQQASRCTCTAGNFRLAVGYPAWPDMG